ncbi:MAG: hypothetical protein AB1630_04850 [bacterium]
MIKDIFSTAIGSFPHKDIEKAISLSLSLDIPVWPQLPKASWRENMYCQFSECLPCVQYDSVKREIYFSLSNIEDELTRFYEKFLEQDLEYFKISKEFSCGFYSFLDAKPYSSYIKGQITGPISFGLSVYDENGKPIIYHKGLFDAIISGLLQKALWQNERLKKFGTPIIFIDEPYLASFGSSVIPISRDDVITWLSKIIDPLKEKGIITGIHCCGNTDWSILLGLDIDILNFDAYNFKDSLFLYKDLLYEFIKERILAWGIVPASDEVLNNNEKTLKERLNFAISQNGFLITPSCGLGSLDEELAEKAIGLTISLTKLCKSQSQE